MAIAQYNLRTNLKLKTFSYGMLLPKVKTILWGSFVLVHHSNFAIKGDMMPWNAHGIVWYERESIRLFISTL